MPNFQIPQFIEQKAKIVGPLTLTQFFYLAGAAAIAFLSFSVFNFFLAFVVTAIAAGLAVALAFVRINGEEMPKIMQSSLNYLLKPRLYTWQRAFAQKTLELSNWEQIEGLRRGMGFEEKLKSVALSIATGKLFSPKDVRLQEEKEKYQAVTFMTGEHRLAKKVDYPVEATPKKTKNSHSSKN